MPEQVKSMHVWQRPDRGNGPNGRKWYSTVYRKSDQKRIQVGTFRTREQAINARLAYINQMAALGFEFE